MLPSAYGGISSSVSRIHIRTHTHLLLYATENSYSKPLKHSRSNFERAKHQKNNSVPKTHTIIQLPLSLKEMACSMDTSMDIDTSNIQQDSELDNELSSVFQSIDLTPSPLNPVPQSFIYSSFQSLAN